MARFFIETLGEERTVKFPYDVANSYSTETDMRDLEIFARQYDHTLLVGMGFRLPRCRALFQDYIRRNPDCADTLSRITFCDAEQFLPEMFNEFVDMNQSRGYANVMSQELFGLKKLLEIK